MNDSDLAVDDEAEVVVLVDESGAVLGVADKSVVHTGDTPLHLAFSCHVFSREGRMLMTRRALGKRAFPGVWTNAFCGHPGLDETPADAARRRAVHELGLELGELELVLPDFRYRAIDASGVVENEICPVFSTVVDGDPNPAPDEVPSGSGPTRPPCALRSLPRRSPSVRGSCCSSSGGPGDAAWPLRGHPDVAYAPGAPASVTVTSVRWKFWNERDAVGPRWPDNGCRTGRSRRGCRPATRCG